MDFWKIAAPYMAVCTVAAWLLNMPPQVLFYMVVATGVFFIARSRG